MNYLQLEWAFFLILRNTIYFLSIICTIIRLIYIILLTIVLYGRNISLIYLLILNITLEAVRIIKILLFLWTIWLIWTWFEWLFIHIELCLVTIILHTILIVSLYKRLLIFLYILNVLRIKNKFIWSVVIHLIIT